MGRIIWLASYPKSGNTWARAFLHNLFSDVKKPFDINKMDEVVGNEAALPNFLPFASTSWQTWTPDDVALWRPLAQKRLSDSKPHNIFCKTHLAALRVRGHPTISPEATGGAVYIVRNPLDIVPSLADHPGLSIDRAIAMMNLENHETPMSEGLVCEAWGSW